LFLPETLAKLLIQILFISRFAHPWKTQQYSFTSGWSSTTIPG